jgi:hypothetical protein
MVLNFSNSTPSTIKNNTIRNFDVQSTSGTSFTGIQVQDGSVSIGNSEGNTISNITTKASSVLWCFKAKPTHRLNFKQFD